MKHTTRLHYDAKKKDEFPSGRSRADPYANLVARLRERDTDEVGVEVENRTPRASKCFNPV